MPSYYLRSTFLPIKEMKLMTSLSYTDLNSVYFSIEKIIKCISVILDHNFHSEIFLKLAKNKMEKTQYFPIQLILYNTRGIIICIENPFLDYAFLKKKAAIFSQGSSFQLS